MPDRYTWVGGVIVGVIVFAGYQIVPDNIHGTERACFGGALGFVAAIVANIVVKRLRNS